MCCIYDLECYRSACDAYANVTKNPLFAAVLAAACITLFAGKRRGVLRHCNK